ncbi:ankyrin repeat domain-containing protein [Planctomycetota bacterium]
MINNFNQTLKGSNVNPFKAKVVLLLLSLILCTCLAAQTTPPLHSAAAMGDLAKVKNLLEAGEYPNVADSNNVTPLMLACEANHPQVVQFLLDNGANVDYQDTQGNCPLHYAARSSSADCTKILLSLSADPSIVNYAEQTPLMIAKAKGNTGQFPILEDALFKQSMEGKDLEGEAQVLLSDPNHVNNVLSRISADPNIANGLLKLAKSFKLEESAWLSRRLTQRSRLSNAVMKQTKAEFDFIAETAMQSEDNKSSQAAATVASDWENRYTIVGKKLRDDYRNSLANTAGDMQRSSRRRPPSRTTLYIGEPAELTAAQLEEENILQSMAPWLQSASDNREALCDMVKQEYLRDMMAIRYLAASGNSGNLTAPIDALMLARSKNIDAIVAKIEDRRQRDSARYETTGVNGSITRRRR